MDQLQPQLQPQPPLQPSGLPTGSAPSGQPKSPFSFLKSKIALLLAVLALLIVAGAVTFFVINQRKPAPVSSSQASSATGDFSISIATDKTELGPSEKATITVTVISSGGFANKVRLTPVLDPNWMIPDVGFGGISLPNRNITPLPDQTASTVLYVQTAEKFPDSKEAFPAKSFQVKGEFQGVVRESNILLLKTKIAK